MMISSNKIDEPEDEELPLWEDDDDNYSVLNNEHNALEDIEDSDMARDSFIWFKERVPTLEELKFILEDYLQGFGAEIKCDEDRWFVKLPGTPSFPFARVCPMITSFPEDRWFEVYVASLEEEDKCIDIITRMQDELTNNIATGYYNIICRYYEAEGDSE